MEEELAAMDEQLADYSPIERPTSTHVSSSAFRGDNATDIQSDSSPEEGSDSGDSDHQSGKGAKKLRIRDVKPSSVKGIDKREKYGIWSRELQESALTEELNISCGVEGSFERTRDCESYDYSKAFEMAAERYQGLSHDEETKGENATLDADDAQVNVSATSSRDLKRRHDSIGGFKRGYHGRHNHNDRQAGKRASEQPKILQPLSTTASDNEEDVAKDITEKLNEEKQELIVKVVGVLGKKKSIDLYERTKKIEECGGMTIWRGTRRRTSGGVFLFLLKGDRKITKEDKDIIFADDRQKMVREKKMSQAQRRRADTEELRLSLVAEDGLPHLPTREELVTKQGPMQDEDQDDVPEEGDVVTNPPPSPATDGRENGGLASEHDRILNSYDGVLDLDFGEDVMDVF